jgi:integrase
MSAQYIDKGTALYKRHQNSKNLAAIMLKYATNAKKSNGDPLPPNTMATSLSKLKRHLVDNIHGGVTPDVFRQIVLPKKTYDEINKASSKRLRDIDKRVIANGAALLKKILPGLGSDEMGPLFTALALATGRRSGELLYSGSLTPIAKGKGYEPYAALFDGQLKTSDGGAYRIPLLAPYALVEPALERLQQMANGKDIAAATLGRYVKKATTGLVDFSISPHDFRRIYSLIAHKQSKSTKALPGFVAEVLGHSSASSVPHYITIEVRKIPARRWKA